MAGVIVISPDQMWTASNSPFRWVLDYLLDKLGDGPAKDEVKNIADHGYDTLDLDNPAQFTPTDRTQILRILHDHLVTDAEQHLPIDLGGRGDYLSALTDLAEQARRNLPT